MHKFMDKAPDNSIYLYQTARKMEVLLEKHLLLWVQ